jgi:5-formyltetrahydrofolate cyclo-ligase
MDLKNRIRRNILIERKTFDINKYHHENELIIENVLIILNSLDTNLVVGSYLPLKGEPDLNRIMLHNSWSIALPKLALNKMNFVTYKLGGGLERGPHKIRQPISTTPAIPDVIIAPALSYSIQGYRLGFGSGYYDKYLSDKKTLGDCLKIGVCFDKFLLEYLPHDAHDVKFDYIITDKMVLKL